ncbi:Competence protein [Mariniradius saccharolyticus AK6]|uniref:Competence protein n=2 Tax=Mariniradius TaxID=1245590 RepID=M7XHB0_9BACT|nr:competence protein CoiA family protein [Mariniradius saccharolyticus]EMS33913.1 Competence protein [Mariniradius saccharolyticus AK6]
MKYALNNGARIEASKGTRGTCPCCGSELIARCGDIKIHHWAHKSSCDPWWETETEWHRLWKNRYPPKWQEFLTLDEETGERHIADVKTEADLIIEFQHSAIDPQERLQRERHYKNLIWVVDGTRLKRDFKRFSNQYNELIKTNKPGIFLIDHDEGIFNKSWLTSSVPVIFDFKGINPTDGDHDIRNSLYCLLQIKLGRYSIIAEFSREAFIKSTINGTWSIHIQNFINAISPKKAPDSHQNQTNPTKPKDGSHFFDPKSGKWKRRTRW